MHIESLKLVYFSPTGTSRTLVQAMERGLDMGTAEHVDITLEAAREKPLQASAQDLLVVAVPVYGGRIPALLEAWLRVMLLDGTPVVCVAVYGNRDYEDALLELSDIVTERGGVPVAGAAFIGEHSFSGPDTPVAVSRPDADDLQRAEQFGRAVREKVQGFEKSGEGSVTVPGKRPYKERSAKGPVDFIEVTDDCVRCGTCAEHCPVGAIDMSEPTATDIEKCIRCCACIKYCPENARIMKESPIMDIAKWLATNCQARKEPESFL